MVSNDPSMSLDWAPEAIIVTVPDGTILHANSRAEGLFGYRKEEIADRPLQMLLPNGLVAGAALPGAPLQHASRIIECVHRDGRRFRAAARWRPAASRDGEFLVVSVREVDDDVEHAAADALRRHKELLTFFSHDLRQALQAIQFICESGAAPDKTAAITEIVTSAAVLLDRMLKISDSEDLAPARERCRIGDVLQILSAELQPVARRKGLSLVVPDPAEEITTDPVLFRELLRQLVADAIRRTLQGRIEVRCGVHASAVHIEVADTRDGNEQDPLDAPLDAPSELATSSPAVAGLGLSIAQRLADALGCRLEVKSGPGEGAAVAVIAPRPPNVGTPDRTRQPN